jgi:hypothetical protein
LSRDSQAIGERAGDAAKEDGVGETIEETEKSKPIDTEEEFLLRVVTFIGEEAVEDGGEATAFFKQGGEGPEGEGENNGAEIPGTGADFREEVFFEEATDGEDGRGAGKEEGSGDGGAEEGEGRAFGNQDENQGNDRRKDGDDISHEECYFEDR